MNLKEKQVKYKKLSEYLPRIKLDDYSFKLHQECVDKRETVG